jgi:hypothetical protein
LIWQEKLNFNYTNTTVFIMEQKIILQELCLNLERQLNELNEANHRRTVELFSGLKPSDYYLPAIHIGTTRPIPTDGKMAWFVEVRVDGKVIFKESYIPKEGEDLKVVEGFMISKVLNSIFAFGVMSSKKFIDGQHFINLC